MAIYKVLFQPLGEYFFGADGSFREGLENAEYFISSREFPSQTTIFGILRYLNLIHKKDWEKYLKKDWEDNKKAVGSSGFSMEGAIEEKDKVADFGLIKGISAVFLNEDNIEAQINKIYVPLPKDASYESSSGYSSFISDSKEMVETIKGKKLIPDYNAKKGIKKGFISIDKGIKADSHAVSEEDLEIIDSHAVSEEDLEIIDSVFECRVKGAIKLNRDIEDEKNKEPISSLFKKKYIKLKQDPGKKEYSFGVYAEIEGDDVEKKLTGIVGMGLGSTPFKVTAKRISDCEKTERLQDDLVLNVSRIFEKHTQKENIIYCISTCFIEKPQEILDKCLFSSIETISNRQLISKDGYKWKKEQTLYTMLDAGSILIAEGENKDEIRSDLEFKGLKQIGYNHYYIGGKV